MRLVTNAALARLRIDFDDQIEIVMLRSPIAKLQHLRKLIGCVDMQNGKRHLSKKRFAREPDENIGIFAHRPRHGDIFKSVIRLSKNKNALVLELIEMSAGGLRHDYRRCSIHWSACSCNASGSSSPLSARRTDSSCGELDAKNVGEAVDPPQLSILRA